jgi:Protein of unknown function (DUF2809)
MRPRPRNRSHTALALLVLVALGLASRLPFMPAVCVGYLGDILWGSMFFVLAAFALPAGPTLRLWLVSTAITELIELSQLYQAPWAQAIRSTHVGGLLLGHAFSWSDTICVALGTSAAVAFEFLCLPRHVKPS